MYGALSVTPEGHARRRELEAQGYDPRTAAHMTHGRAAVECALYFRAGGGQT